MTVTYDKIKENIRHMAPFALICAMGLSMASCFKDEESTAEKYAEWRKQNEEYLAEAEAMTDESGAPYYEKIIPSWAPQTYVLMHWHNDRALTASNLSPMDNSTTKITYQLLNVEGEEISNSFSNTDSIYTSKPSSNIIGMWTALTHMNVGDTVTMVIPSTAAYGVMNYSGIRPYSTLIYNVKLKAVTAYEIP